MKNLRNGILEKELREPTRFKETNMAYLAETECCGVAEVRELSNYTPLKCLLREAKYGYFGMLTAYFKKGRKEKKMQGKELYKEMRNYGFKPLKKFINPNTGSTLWPLVYVMTKEERGDLNWENILDLEGWDN